MFLKEHLLAGEKVELPIPTIYFSSFMGDGVNDCLVIQNLCADRYFQVSCSRWEQTGERLASMSETSQKNASQMKAICLSQTVAQQADLVV